MYVGEIPKNGYIGASFEHYIQSKSFSICSSTGGDKRKKIIIEEKF